VADFKIPKEYKDRLKDAAKQHKFASGETMAQHLIDKGLNQYEVPDAKAPLAERMAHVVDEQGYSSTDELIEHLLERGLMAYEEPVDDPAELEARLRGLGYID